MILCVLCLTGCYINSSKQKSEKNDLNNQEVSSKLNKIIQCCQKIYEQEYKEVDTLEEKQKIINYFGKEGYSAVDTENQINMEKPEPVEKFCEAAQNQKGSRGHRSFNRGRWKSSLLRFHNEAW